MKGRKEGMNECRVWELLVPLLLLQVATVKRKGGDHCRQARQAVPNR